MTGPQSSTPMRIADLKAFGPSTLAEYYFAYWASPALAFTIFGLFGLTAEARASYWCIICAVGGWFEWNFTTHDEDARPTSSTIDFAVQPQATLSLHLETRCVHVLVTTPSSCLIKMHRSYSSLAGTTMARKHNAKPRARPEAEDWARRG